MAEMLDINSVKENWNEAQKALYDQIMHERMYTINSSGKSDTFIRAWITFTSILRQKPSFFNRKGIERNYNLQLDAIKLNAYVDASEEEKEVYRVHWMEFAKRYIDICLKDKGYGSTLMGLVTMSKSKVKNFIEAEIIDVCENYPKQSGREELFVPLKEIMLQQLEVTEVEEE